MHIFCYDIILFYVKEKYMEFDLNDQGEIGKITLVYNSYIIFR